MRVRIHDTLTSLDARAWNALAGKDYPFLRHEFLSTLERTGCIGEAAGWQLQLITLEDERGLAAAAPGWLKQHSYGEFVFDFAWAQAYHRHGLSYYPKLILAAPFTPATGPRLLVREDLAREQVLPSLIAAIETQRDNASRRSRFHCCTRRHRARLTDNFDTRRFSQGLNSISVRLQPDVHQKRIWPHIVR